jgi:membrane fusion protein, multidrug efflux system
MTEGTVTKRRSVGFFVGGLIVVLLILGAYLLLLSTKQADLRDDAKLRASEAAEGVAVNVGVVTPSSTERTITIPGEVRPYSSVTLYAKVSGYLKKIAVDKGDMVKEGQLIATIESPETDRAIQSSEATAKNKRSIADRQQGLLKKGILSTQEAEQSASDADAAEANLQALKEQRNYQTIRAPFSGRVTARFADAGALVQSAANSQSSALPIVTIAQEERLRIYIYLDQRDATFIREGDSVHIRLLERPGVDIPATITRYTGEIDPKTRTLLAEIDLDNKKDLILPGSFVQVSLTIKAHPLLQMPSSALIVKGPLFFAAVVDTSGILHFQKITIADNDGKTCQIISGLTGGEKLALGVGDALRDGDKVKVTTAAPAK